MKKFFMAGCLVFLFAMLCCSSVFAEGTAMGKAVVSEITGAAQVKTGDGEWMTAEVGMVLSEGSVIRTEPESVAVVSLEGGEEAALVEVKEGSELKIAELFNQTENGASKTLLDLAIGEILITSKKLQTERSKFEVKTPTSIVGVRGTTFSVSVETEK